MGRSRGCLPLILARVGLGRYTEDMTTREYDITGLAVNPEATLAKARKLADRCAKKGMSGGYTLSIDTRFVGVQDEDGYESGEERHFLIVSGKPAAIAGWRFVALLTWVNGLPLITQHPEFTGPAVDRASLIEGACDHCGVKRNRKYQIVVESMTAGERKVVGSACCKDFLGQVFNPSFFVDPFSAHFDSERRSSGERSFLAGPVLVNASRVIRKHGFVSRSQADDSYMRSTSDLVALLYANGNAGNEMRRETPEADADDFANRESVIKWVEAETATSDWMLNLQTVLSADKHGNRWVPARHLALAVSAMGVWMRKQAEAARVALPVEEEFTGTIGERLELPEATVVAERALESQWGSSTVYTIIADGHRFDWITSGSTYLTVGETGTLKGTVKNHRDWATRDGYARKTTVLTRCRFLSAS